MTMKIPMQTEVGDIELEFRPAPSGNPAHLVMVWHLPNCEEMVSAAEMPRIWFDRAFLRDIGLADG